MSVFACGAPGEDAQEGGTLASTAENAPRIAHIELEGGTTLDFFDVAPGVVAISAEYPESAENPLADFRGTDMPVTALFERLTGQPSPEALELAEQRGVEMTKAPALIGGAPTRDGDGEGPQGGPITPYHSDAVAQRFADLYCSSHNLYCRLHITGWAQRTTDEPVKQAGAIVRPHVGSVGLQLLFWKNGSWRNILNETVLEGKVRQITYNYRIQGTGPFYSQHYVQMRIDQGEGDHFDYSFWAYDGSGVVGTGIPAW